jgi:hypothetical protein
MNFRDVTTCNIAVEHLGWEREGAGKLASCEHCLIISEKG